MNTSVVIVCAGNSTRMGGVNKILLPLGERKVIGVTMQAFEKCESVAEIIIVCREADMPAIKEEAEKAGITKVIKDAKVFGGATLGVPVKDTIKTVDDGLITDTPPRNKLYITQTPQIFKRSLYFEGIDFALEHGLDFTDDCQLVEAIGGKVAMTVGDYTNIKITTPEDIAIAEILLKNREEN